MINTDTSVAAQLDAAAIAHLQDWQGRSETLADDITIAPVAALSATLDRDNREPALGTETAAPMAVLAIYVTSDAQFAGPSRKNSAGFPPT